MNLSEIQDLVAIAFAFGGVIWRVSVLLNKIKEDFHNELTKTNAYLAKLDKEVSQIAVETKFVREDHDNLVKIAEHTKNAKDDINAQHAKIRDLENKVTTFISTWGKR